MEKKIKHTTKQKIYWTQKAYRADEKNAMDMEKSCADNKRGEK